MKHRWLFKAKEIDSGIWRVGHLINEFTLRVREHWMGTFDSVVDPATICQCTGKYAGKSYRGTSAQELLIFEMDICRVKWADYDRIREVSRDRYDLDFVRFNQDRLMWEFCDVETGGKPERTSWAGYSRYFDQKDPAKIEIVGNFIDYHDEGGKDGLLQKIKEK